MKVFDIRITRPVDALIESLWNTVFVGYDKQDAQVVLTVHESAVKVLREIVCIDHGEYPYYKPKQMLEYGEYLWDNCTKYLQPSAQ